MRFRGRSDASYVLFNRQPSLHKMSMMSHRIKLMNYSSGSSIQNMTDLQLSD